VVATVAGLKPGHGFNAATGEYGDLVAEGVIDPVKVNPVRGAERSIHRRNAADHRGTGGGQAGEGGCLRGRPGARHQH